LTTLSFQFQNGTIDSRATKLTIILGYKFQFQHGTIN